MDIDTVKNFIKEDLTDAEAKDLLKKMEKAKQAEKENKPYLTFNWGKAIMLIHGHNIQNAAFGLKGDWDATNAIGLKNGKPTDPLKMSKFGYALTSNWCTPQIYDIDTETFYDCYRKLESDELLHNSDLWWPEDAKISFDFVSEVMEDLS